MMITNQPKAIVIGSIAMKHHFPDFPRIPMDKDIIIRKQFFQEMIDIPEIDDIIGIEKVHIADNGLSAKVKYQGDILPYEYLFADGQKSLELILDQISDDSQYASPAVLYSLKKAHIHFPIKFNKHIKDLMFLREKLRQNKGISLEQDLSSETDLLDELPALTDLHFRETEKRLGKLRTPKMNQSREEFFGKSKKYVKSYYVHDDMHKAMAHLNDGLPLYEFILRDGSEVETDPEKWKKLALRRKMECVLEEVYVIALERKILPSMFQYGDFDTLKFSHPKEAFDWALYRVCTTLCDGFFRDFAVKAYDEIQKQYNPNYVETFFKNISKWENQRKPLKKNNFQ